MATDPVLPHRARQMAESFGVDAAGYDHARPPYPADIIDRILELAPGRRIVDVGCGTGILARQLQEAGCEVLGIEPDPRMAGFAREHGTEVEVTTFEEWQPRDRTYDAVVAGQAWHWVDPQLGPAKVLEALRPDGVLALFGHVFEPPDPIAAAFGEALHRVAPGLPFDPQHPRRPLETYQQVYGSFAENLDATGCFGTVEDWHVDWSRDYTRDEWLALLPTTGGMTRLGETDRETVLDAVGAVIDEQGGGFTMRYVTLGMATRRLVDDAG